MTITWPFLLMILHFSQIFLTDGFTFICRTIPFIKIVQNPFGLFRSPGDASLCQVINRHFNGYAIAGQNADIIHAKLAGNMGRYNMAVRQLDFEVGVGQSLKHRAFKLDHIILWQKNPSLLILICDTVIILLFQPRSD